MIRIITFILCFTANLSGFANQVIIRGNASPYKGRQLTALITEDYISEKQSALALTTIDSTGSFELFFDLKKTACIILQYGPYQSFVHAEPGAVYEIRLVSDPQDQPPVFGKTIKLAPEFVKSDSSNINVKIRQIDSEFDLFFNQNLEAIYKRSARNVEEKFKAGMMKKYSGEPDLYVKNYLVYNMAFLDDAVGHSRKNISEWYLKGPVLYDNKAYMQFFNQFYKQYLRILFLSKYDAALKKELNNNRSFKGLSAVMLNADSTLTNDTLRELILVKGLRELYYQADFSKQNIEMVLNTASASKVKPVSIAAYNVLNDLKKLQKGSKPPEFSLPDSQSKETGLSLYKGQYVLLIFDAAWCTECLQENISLLKFHERNNDKIQLLSIIVDGSYAEAASIYQRERLSWPVLDGTNDPLIKENYSVKSLPMYYLIDKDSDFLLSPAPRPSEGLENYLNELLKVRRR